MPHLFIWGDHWNDNPFWVKSRAASERWRDALAAAGGDVTWIDLPAHSIRGNSHALMADDNSAEIAGLVLDWMTVRDLVHH